jgi:hypothetical protein
MMERSYANSGKEWSNMDVADLQQCVKIGMADTDIAGFLRRPTEEIRERAAELVGISLSPGKDNKSDSQYLIEPEALTCHIGELEY